MTNSVKQAAQLLFDARRDGRQLDSLPEGARPASKQDALDIQDAILALGTDSVSAWKVGAPAPGAAVTVAPIATSLIHASGVALPSGKRHNFVIESELAFRLGADLPVRDKDYSADEVLAALDGVMVAIEVVESRYQEWPDVDPLWHLADMQANDCLVLGEVMATPADLDCISQPVRLEVNGSVRLERKGGLMSESPFWVIAAAASSMGTRGAPLSGRGFKAGDVITTGSWTGVEAAGAGQSIKVSFAGLGEASMTYE